MSKRRFFSILLILTLCFSLVAPLQAASLSTPRLMLTDYSSEPALLTPDSEGELSLTVKNRSTTTDLVNLKLILTSESGSLLPEGVGTLYLAKLDAEASHVWTLDLQVLPDAAGGSHGLTLLTEYENTAGQAYSASDRILLVVQAPEPTPEPTPLPDPTPLPEPTPEPQPRLLLSEYAVETSDGKLAADSRGSLALRIQNRSTSVGTRNLLLSLHAESPHIIPLATATYYQEALAPSESLDWQADVQVLPDTPPGIYPLTLQMDYEDSSGLGLSASQELHLTVTQALRVEYSEPSFPARLTQGDMATLALNVMNLGQGPVHNIVMTADLPGLAQGSSELIGNLEAGASRAGQMSIAVPYDAETTAIEGELTLSYEDPEGRVYHEAFALQTRIEEREERTAADDEHEGEGLVPLPWLIAAGAVILILVIGLIAQTIRVRRLQEADEARL